MPRRRTKESYFVKLPNGVDCEMVVEKREDGAQKVVAQPPKGVAETGLQRLERHALQAVENMLVEGIVDCGDGDYVVPSAWAMPDGSRPDHPYEVHFTAYEMTCTCDYGEVAQGAACAHLGAVYAMMMFNPMDHAEQLDAVRRYYGQVEVQPPHLEPTIDVLTLFKQTRISGEQALADLFPVGG